MYTESCAFDHASVTFKDTNECATVLTCKESRCECFCRVVPRKGQRLKELETSPALMRASYPSLQVRSDSEEALKHVLRAACEEVHLEYSTTWLETPASDGRGENSVRAMKEMVQRQRESFKAMRITFSFKHLVFPLCSTVTES